MRTLREEPKQPLHVPLTLLSILVIAFLLRLPGLDRDLWYDETWSLFHARGADVLPRIIPNGPELTSDLFRRDGGWRESLLAIGHVEWIPPLYYLLLRIWINLFGESNQSVRLFSVIPGAATLLAIFFLGRSVFDEKVGLAAAGVLAILPVHIQYSQEVRAYALAVLLATLASWAFWSGYQATGRPDERKHWLTYLGFATLSLYTHYFTGWVLAAHGIFALLQPHTLRKALLKRLAMVAAAVLLLLAPWVLSPYFNNQVFLAGQLPFIPTFWTSGTPKRIAALLCYFVAGYLPGIHFKSVLGFLVLGLYAVTALALDSIMRAREKRSPLLFSLLLLFTPIVAVIGTAAYLNESGLIAVPRFVLPSLGGLCLLVGGGIRSSRWRLLIAVILVVLSLHFQVQWHYAHTSSSPHLGFQWAYGNVSLAVARISQEARPGELILFDEVYLPAVWNVYDRSRLPQLLMGRMSFLQFNPPMDFEARWREVENKYRGIYFVRRAEQPPSEVVERVEAHYRLVSKERVGRLEIRYYIKPSPGGLLNAEHN